MDYMKRYKEWLNSDYFDSQTKRELAALEDGELKESFLCDLEFGTGGLRGKMGVGTNRMNRYTVRKATQGLANYILAQKKQEKGVAIAYDSRRMSSEFARETALCLCANGIPIYLFESLRPTPELSFALRRLKCAAGVVVTASHNPPEYNGYKVYWEDGAQITFPRDQEIIAEVKKIESFDQVKTITREAATASGLYHVIGEEIDEQYMEELKKQILNPEIIAEQAEQLKIVYTPLHGTGNKPVRRILKELGFTQVYCVEEQEEPDGDFPTVSYPNPEDADAFRLALDLAKRVDADIVLATDPDADRLGVYGKDRETGSYIRFTGNMTGALICEYELSQRKKQGKLPENGAVVTTIVSGRMAEAIAKAYGIQVMKTLTGFKYIGEQIKLFEEKESNTYVFGFEESYGCLLGTYARDKDAVVAAMVLCEIAAYYKQENRTIWDQMKTLYAQYGWYEERLHTVTMEGQAGKEKITALMEHIRFNLPKKMGSFDVKSVSDYAKDIRYDFETDEMKKTGLPKSNVLYFDLTDDAWCCVRPSGTEPKVKIYAGVKGADQKHADEKMDELLEKCIELLGI